jgi:hypothetical protein
MNFRILSENNLSDFAANVMTLLDGGEIDAIDANTRASLAAAIGSKPDELAEQTASAAGLKGMRMAAVSTRNATKAEIIELMSRVRDALRAGRASKAQYELCGFDYPVPAAEIYVAQDPTELSANGFSNGINKIRFSGNNRRSSVVYEVWRRHGDNGPWLLHATTTKQSFIDRSVRPGQYYEYRVRAVAAKSISNFSNTAVVYGAS